MDALLTNLLFYFLAAVVLGSAAYTAFSPRLVHAAFSLLFTFFGLACLYILLGADFVGISQVVVYVGGILVLLLFGVMFTQRLEDQNQVQTMQWKWGLGFLGLFFLILVPVIYVTPWPVAEDVAAKPTGSTIAQVGELLLTKYFLPFEIASLLLLIALVGAVVIARGEAKTGEIENLEVE
ncbi:MAG: NADH-quinone oxidoreductase subunit J [bacterium]|nr:NADH-quinone oxidoreductase subunit J [bacterium]